MSIKFNSTKDNSVIYAGVIKRYPRLIIPILVSMLLMYVSFTMLSELTDFKNTLSFKRILLEALYFAPFEHISLANYALWTISFEIYGSLLVFSLLAIFGDRKLRLVFYSIVLIFFYWNTSFYALFILGIILSDLYVNQRLRISVPIRIVLFVIGIILSTSPYPREGVDVYGGLYAYLKVFDAANYNKLYHMMMITGSSALFISILDSNMAEKILNAPLFQYLGRISFPLYILHVTILGCVSYFLHANVGEINIYHFMLATLFSVILCFIISSVFEKFVDLPAIKLSNRISEKLK